MVLYPTLPPALKHRMIDPFGNINTSSSNPRMTRKHLMDLESSLANVNEGMGSVADLYSYADALAKPPGSVAIISFCDITTRSGSSSSSPFQCFTGANIRNGNGIVNAGMFVSTRTLAVKTPKMCGADKARLKNSQSFCDVIKYMAKENLVAVVRTSSTSLSMLAPCLDSDQLGDGGAVEKGGYHAVLYSAKDWETLVKSVCPEDVVDGGVTGAMDEGEGAEEDEGEMVIDGPAPTLWLPGELEVSANNSRESNKRAQPFRIPAWLSVEAPQPTKPPQIAPPVPSEELWLPSELELSTDDQGEAR